MTNLIGRQFGQYKIIDTIGGGGMGEVYLAQDTRLTRQVAVKILPLEAAQNRELVQRFRREANAAAGLDHPNIIDVYDLGVETGLYYIVMRYVNGPTLSDILKNEGPLPPERVLRIMAQLTDALEYAHRRDIIHRDIKPANVMLERNDFVTLMDFGIARAPSEEKLTMVGQVMGTAGYMSPEQASGRPVDHRTDIFALGVLIEEMLTGQRPGFGQPPSANLPPAIREVVARSRAGRVDDRYGSVRALYDDLRGAIASASASDQPRSPAQSQALKLRLKDGREYQLQPGVLRIGRAADNDVVLRDEKVSRHHAEIRTDQRGSAVIDLGSTNGTYIDRQRLTPNQPHPLTGSAWVQVGKNVMVKIEPGEVARPVEEHLSTDTQARAVLQTASSGELPQPPPPPASATSQKKSGGRKLWWIGGGIVGVLGLLALACIAWLFFPTDASPSPTRTPTRGSTTAATSTPRPTSTSIVDLDTTDIPDLSAGDLIFEDSFASRATSEARWDLPDEDDYGYEVDGGQLVAWHEDSESFSWAESLDAYEDFELTMDVKALEGGEDAMFGMLFAMDDESDNYLGCLVQGDDSGYCMEKAGGEIEFGDWVRVNVMHQAYGVNKVRVIRVGDNWAFYVNDDCVGAGRGGGVAEGYLGLAASTFDAPVEIAFDNLELRVPSLTSRAQLSCRPESYSAGAETETETETASTATPRPTAAPTTAPTSPPEPTAAPSSGGNVFEFHNYTGDQSCHFEFWGPASYSVDVGVGESKVIRNVPNGEYGWKTFITGIGESSGNSPVKMVSGGRCVITCSKHDGGYYTGSDCTP
ncbi:MAG: protein kinase domain-containing protein [Anaerolineales bacterium]